MWAGIRWIRSSLRALVAAAIVMAATPDRTVGAGATGSALLDALRESVKTDISIPDKDRETMLREVAGLLAATDQTVAYAQMSPIRRKKLSQRLQDFVANFPSGQRSTPLQREAHVAASLMSVKTLFAMPSYPPDMSPPLKSQLDAIAATMVEWAEQAYPEVVGTDAQELIKQSLRQSIYSVTENDLTPAFKRSLPADQFPDVLKDFRQKLDGALRRPIGQSVTNWGQMTAHDRREYINENAESIASTVCQLATPKRSWLGNQYCVAAQEYYKDVVPKPFVSPAELERFEALQKAASKEFMTLARERRTQQQIEVRRMMKRAEVRAIYDKAFSFDDEDEAIASISPEATRLPNIDTVDADGQPRQASDSNDPAMEGTVSAAAERAGTDGNGWAKYLAWGLPLLAVAGLTLAWVTRRRKVV